MTEIEIKNTPELVDFMIDKSVTTDSRAKVRKRLEEICDMAIKALEQQPCEDAISRQAVLEKLRTCYDTETKEYSDASQWINYEDAVAEMENLPSVTPQPKKGKWIEVEVHNCHATLKCSECNRVIEPTYTFGEYSYEDIKKFYPYCHCGARMAESEVEE